MREWVLVLTTLKQELSSESGEENRDLQLTGLMAAADVRSSASGGLLHLGLS